jgi:F-type H+-transporting ATPase subunit delta
MDQGLIPNRYAKALFKFALEKGQTPKIYELMKCLVKAFAEQPRLQAAVSNPYISADDKTRLLMTAATADATKDACFADFLALLHHNRRIDFVRQIALAYLDIYREANNIYVVKVTTAASLPAEELDRLRQLVVKHLNGASMEFSQDVDPELIGGFVITINSERLDASVSNELKQLRLKLLSN